MAFWNNWFSGDNTLTEATKSFKNKGRDGISDKQIERISGEGVDDALFMSIYGRESAGNFNNFYNDFINTTFATKRIKIENYRFMSEMPEISSVLEDIAIESTQEDGNGKILQMDILDADIKENENIVHNLEEEFDELFHRKMRINANIIDYVRTYYVDAELYLEKVVQKGKASNGIVNVKKLPTETMDYFLNPRTGRIEWYYQALSVDVKPPKSIEDAEKEDKIIVFYPEQISHIDYGIYQGTKKNVQGYLEKSKQPFNQLKLLETSVVIYRIVKAPERLVFTIDTGAMPRDKSLKFVEKIKKNLTQRVEFDTKTGRLRNQTDVMSMMDNYFLPQCLSLSTGIDCLDGKKTLYQMIDDYNNGITNEVLSIDQDTGQVVVGEVEWAGITRKDAKMVRVHIDNDEYIDCTPDHKFVMRDGSEIEAQHLVGGSSLMPYYTRDKKVSSNSNEYRQVFDIATQEWKFIHRLVCPVSKAGNVVHHEDFDRYNNRLDNLIEMTSIDHFSYHSSLSSENLKRMWKDKNFRGMMINTARTTANKRWSNSDNIVKQSNRMKQLWKDNYNTFYSNVSKPKTDDHKQSLSDSISQKWSTDDGYRERVSLASKSRWTDDYREKMSDAHKAVISNKCTDRLEFLYNTNVDISMDKFISLLSVDGMFISQWGIDNKDRKGVMTDMLGKSSFYNIINSMGYKTYTDFKKGVVVNHKVVSVEWLDIKEDTGCLTIRDTGNNHNFCLSNGVFVKNSSDGRGSSVESIGGNPSGFAELDDLYYFARKLYIALKYPISRVIQAEERRQGETLFMGGNSSEITIDEIRWAKFLERHQQKFCQVWTDMFLLHLEFKGLKAEYDIDINKINITMTPPNDYKQQMQQMILETQMNNYTSLANNPEFSKSFLMKTYLKWDDNLIRENAEGFKEDDKLFPKEEF